MALIATKDDKIISRHLFLNSESSTVKLFFDSLLKFEPVKAENKKYNFFFFFLFFKTDF